MEKRYSGNRLKIIHFVQTWKLDVTLISKINLFYRFNNISTPLNQINKFISIKGACPVQKWAWCPRPLHNVSFDEFLSGFILNYFHGILVTKTFDILLQNYYWISNLCLTLHYFQFQNLYLDIWFQNWSVFSSIIKGFYNDYEGLNSK